MESPVCDYPKVKMPNVINGCKMNTNTHFAAVDDIRREDLHAYFVFNMVS